MIIIQEYLLVLYLEKPNCWKTVKNPTTENWLRKLWYIHMKESTQLKALVRSRKENIVLSAGANSRYADSCVFYSMFTGLIVNKNDS